MNKLILFLTVAVASLAFCVIAADIDLESVPNAAATIKVKRVLGTWETNLEHYVNGTAASSRGLGDSMVNSSDTNATTTATAYTPRYIGDILIGFKGSGTNAMWIAKGTTTNDWVCIVPDTE